jgi:hypothetical protein
MTIRIRTPYRDRARVAGADRNSTLRFPWDRQNATIERKALTNWL